MSHHASDLPTLPSRSADAHKGDFGTVLIVAGSTGMSGAAALGGRAALRSGAGLVRVATAADCQPTVAALDPCYTTIPLACDAHGRITLAAANRLATEVAQASVLAIGPGLGQSEDIQQLVQRFYDAAPIPMVLDADALNALAALDLAVSTAPPAPRLWTPHPGEYRRLTNVEATQQRDHAIKFAKEQGITLLLKGANTLITDGDQQWENATGNPGMATGGSGDVLTGILAGLIAQGMSAADAARLGAHVHGLAGDLAVQQLGQVSLVASDLIAYLPQAFQQVLGNG